MTDRIRDDESLRGVDDERTDAPGERSCQTLVDAEREQNHFNQKIVELESEREKVSLRLGRLRDATISVVRRRERVPQPLFWSLFHAEVSEIKKRKEREREAREKLLGTAKE